MLIYKKDDLLIEVIYLSRYTIRGSLVYKYIFLIPSGVCRWSRRSPSPGPGPSSHSPGCHSQPGTFNKIYEDFNPKPYVCGGKRGGGRSKF